MLFTHRDLSMLRLDDADTYVIRHGSLPAAPARPGPVGTGPEGMLTNNVDGQRKGGVSARQFSPLMALRQQWEQPDVR